MKLFYLGKDGGSKSTVWGYWLWEIKSLCSLVLLRFEPGTRDAYHSHAFDCISLVLGPGVLWEEFHDGSASKFHARGDIVITRKRDFHRVTSIGRTWVLSLRGPWVKMWREALPDDFGGYGAVEQLTHGRVRAA